MPSSVWNEEQQASGRVSVVLSPSESFNDLFLFTEQPCCPAQKARCPSAHRERWKEHLGCQQGNTKHSHTPVWLKWMLGEPYYVGLYVSVRVCVCVCVLIKSVRYQQSTIHQMDKYNRSNPAVILLLRLWCHDVIGNYSSATTKCVFGYRSDWSESRNTGGEFINDQVLTITKNTNTADRNTKILSDTGL